MPIGRKNHRRRFATISCPFCHFPKFLPSFPSAVIKACCNPPRSFLFEVNRAAAPSSESQPIPVSRPPVSIPPAARADTPVWEYDPNRAYLCESPEMRHLPPSTGIRSVPRLFQPEESSHDRDIGVRDLNMQGLLRLRHLRTAAQYDE